MRMLPAGVPMSTEQRYRWFLGLVEVQTWQSQPSIGTPIEVPVPRNVNVRVPAWGSFTITPLFHRPRAGTTRGTRQAAGLQPSGLPKTQYSSIGGGVSPSRWTCLYPPVIAK